MLAHVDRCRQRKEEPAAPQSGPGVSADESKGPNHVQLVLFNHVDAKHTNNTPASVQQKKTEVPDGAVEFTAGMPHKLKLHILGEQERIGNREDLRLC